MKTLQEMTTTFDRISTHEELSQVLALVTEDASGPAIERPSAPDETRTLREAVADLWRDAAADEHDEETHVRGVSYPWTEVLAGKAKRIN